MRNRISAVGRYQDTEAITSYPGDRPTNPQDTQQAPPVQAATTQTVVNGSNVYHSQLASMNPNREHISAVGRYQDTEAITSYPGNPGRNTHNILSRVDGNPNAQIPESGYHAETDQRLAFYMQNWSGYKTWGTWQNMHFPLEYRELLSPQMRSQPVLEARAWQTTRRGAPIAIQNYILNTRTPYEGGQ